MCKKFASVLTVGLLLFIASEAFAESKTVRVRGTLRGTVSFVPTDIISTNTIPTNVVSGLYSVRVDVRGTLSELGRVDAAWQGNVFIDENLQPTPRGAQGWVIRTTSGDTLRGTLNWTAIATNQPLLYALRGAFQSATGTQRLRGAKAQGTVRGTINAVTGRAVIRLNSLVDILETRIKSERDASVAGSRIDTSDSRNPDARSDSDARPSTDTRSTGARD